MHQHTVPMFLVITDPAQAVVCTPVGAETLPPGRWRVAQNILITKFKKQPKKKFIQKVYGLPIAVS